MGVLMLLGGVCVAADATSPVAPSLCSDAPGAPRCKAPAKDLKAAQQAFSRGLKL
jgi:hypothetical protein